MDEKDVFCVACGEGIVINLDMMNREIECPACHTHLRLDEADDDAGQDDIEWSPDVDSTDATRVFGPSMLPHPEKSATDSSTLQTTTSPKPAKNGLLLIPLFATAALGSVGVTGWFLQKETHRADLIEKRLALVEKELIPMQRKLAESRSVVAEVEEQQRYLDELDDTVSQIATVLRLQNAVSLQNEYSAQSAQKNLIRQESNFENSPSK